MMRLLPLAACLALAALPLAALTAQQDSQAAPPATEAAAPTAAPAAAPKPLVGNADVHFKGAIQRALGQLSNLPRHEGRRPVLILELVPARRHSGYGEGTDFERALSNVGMAPATASQFVSAVLGYLDASGYYRERDILARVMK